MSRLVLRLFLFSLVTGVAGVLPAEADPRDDARQQVEFGIEVAQRGLWREAIYRWERATEIDPSYAPAFNNLAVAYEQEGDLARAQSAYERAMALDPGNDFITQNYELFREINDRTNPENIQ